jgi:hypothetical protein
MDKNTNIVYTSNNFLGNFRKLPFNYEFTIDENISKRIYLGEEIEESTFEFFILNLITTNSTISKRSNANWSIIMYNFLLSNFKKFTIKEFKSKDLAYLKVRFNLT